MSSVLGHTIGRPAAHSPWRSAAGVHATTPGIAAAAAVSTPSIVAWT